ncbi:hypothetical protein MMC07_007338 [Pseudocyphellaria aurata]|nr:hypothetical protein [Pseudocyphellaria aurata]
MSPSNQNSQMEEEQHADSRTPLLSPAGLKPSSFLQKTGNLFQNWWLWEILASLVSLLSILSIVVILIVYDSRSLPDWPFVFNINSVISFFATIAKLSLSSVVGATISQSKWLWYRQEKPRPLQDLQLFDDASRGPWGAAGLLFSLRARHLALLGAVITILTLLFDPFIQQVVVYPDRLVPAEMKATIARAQTYEVRDEGVPLPSVVELSMKAAIYNGIFDIQDKAASGIGHTCSSGNCTWPPFPSLGVCSRCVNVTSYMEKSCNQTGCYRLSLPNGPTLTGLGGQINSSLSNISPSLKDTYASVVQFASLISKGANQSEDAHATECAIWYCVQNYTASVDEGKPSQTVISSWRNDSARLSDSSDLYYRPPGSMANDPNGTFKVAHWAARAMNEFLSEIFTGSGGINNSGSAFFSSDVMQALYSTDNVTVRVNNLAISMTNNIREQNHSPVMGTTWQTETYIHVRWRWFIFPSALLILSLLFLLGAIVETSYREVMIWKSNNVALLFHGRELSLQPASGRTPVNTLSQMSEQAKTIMVDLVQSGEDWKFVQR